MTACCGTAVAEVSLLGLLWAAAAAAAAAGAAAAAAAALWWILTHWAGASRC